MGGHALTGAADGWLPRSYAGVGRSLFEAASRKVDEYGVVRDACGSPTFGHPGTSAEGQAFHLLAAACLITPPSSGAADRRGS